jgi:transcription elongation factor S-II
LGLHINANKIGRLKDILMKYSKMPPIQSVLLTQKAEVKSVKLPLDSSGKLGAAQIQTILKKKVTPEMIGSYRYKGTFLFLFGFSDGKAGTENKHELPPPLDSTLYFGDILVVASKDESSYSKPVAFKVEDYETFYTKMFGGFDELESDEEMEDTLDTEVEAEVDGDADANEIVGAVEEDDKDEDEEEDEDEDEDEAEAGAEVEAEVEAEAEVEVVKPRKKQSVKAAAAAKKAGQQLFLSTTPGNAYPGFLHLNLNEYLQKETAIKLSADQERQAVVKSLTNLFKTTLTPQQVLELEQAIYNGAIREAERLHVDKTWAYPPFVNLYRIHARHIASNFHPDSYVKNNELFTRFRAGEVTMSDIGKMDTYELFHSRWKDSFDQQQVREKRQLEGNKSMATDQFLCGRCHKRECTYYEMQTRSADEPMTIFITCLNCGKHWRQ